jgi:hypothetical protein
LARFFLLSLSLLKLTILKKIILIIFALVGYTGMGQVDLNEYKYIIIPKKLADFKENNQYLTSTLLKHQFIKIGFTAVYDDALPEDVYLDRCLGLTALLNDNSSMLSTKATIVLENCRGEKVFSSKEVKSRIKGYKEAYKVLITESMVSFDDLNYSYKKKVVENKPITVSFKNDIKSLDGDSKEQKETADLTGIGIENSREVVKQTSSMENQSYKSMEPAVSNIKQAAPKTNIVTEAISETAGKEMMYAQAIPNGYQLIDSTPKVKMKLLNSSTENVFIGQADGKSGMVFQKNGIWIFEYYAGADLIQEELNIKF